MKRAVILTLTLVAGAGAFHLACSSDDTTGTTNTSGGTTTSSSTSGGGSNSATSGAPVIVDTCRPAGGSCLCDCKITGQTEDKKKTCAEPGGGNGECRKVCCTGEGTSSGTSGTTTSSSGDSGDGDGG